MDIFGGKRGFWPFGGILGLLEAFYMVLWPFRGIWTNEPCSGVDEVVNHFWVLTGSGIVLVENGHFSDVLCVPKISCSKKGKCLESNSSSTERCALQWRVSLDSFC